MTRYYRVTGKYWKARRWYHRSQVDGSRIALVFHAKHTLTRVSCGGCAPRLMMPAKH